MNSQRKAVVREVSEFIRRSAPPGAIEYAKSTEPYSSAIRQAQADAGDSTIPIKTSMKRYAGAFFGAFRKYFDERHPDPLDAAAVKALSLVDIWHAGTRVVALGCKSDMGDFNITPRTSADPKLQPSFSAAEVSLLRVLGISHRLMVESGLIDDSSVIGDTMKTIMAVKKVFPGSIVTEVTDSLGDKHHLIPSILQD